MTDSHTTPCPPEGHVLALAQLTYLKFAVPVACCQCDTRIRSRDQLRAGGIVLTNNYGRTG